MENLIAQALIQARPLPGADWSCISALWQWGFGLGFLVGIVGAVVLFLKK
ncbi:MAG: hypothetical protein HY913_13635 [Desulfomonile tiedjei]|nr:hypothetical protein [Desulfomonile tiedjei]